MMQCGRAVGWLAVALSSWACAQGAAIEGESSENGGAPGSGGATLSAGAPSTGTARGGATAVLGNGGSTGTVSPSGGGTGREPTCTDRILNGTESDIDCGGDCPSKCAFGKKCNAAEDCEIAVCSAENLCTTCTSGTKDGDETDIDCGGSCDRCQQGQACLTRSDCATYNCPAETLVCGEAVNCLAVIPEECACDPQNASDIPLCEAYVQCYLDNDCDPTSTEACATTTCSVNEIGGGNAPQQAALDVYRCACVE